MNELIALVVSVIILTFGVVTRPERARCPQSWWFAEGVRRDGSFACFPPVIGGDDDVLTGRNTGYMAPERLRGRIYCDGQDEPVISWRSDAVFCRRRVW